MALRDFIHDKSGELKVHVFLGKETVPLGLQYHHQAHSQEHRLKAKGFTLQRETSKDSNHFPDTSCATTPFYRKVSRRHWALTDSWLIYSQEDAIVTVVVTPWRMAADLVL